MLSQPLMRHPHCPRHPENHRERGTGSEVKPRQEVSPNPPLQPCGKGRQRGRSHPKITKTMGEAGEPAAHCKGVSDSHGAHSWCTEGSPKPVRERQKQHSKESLNHSTSGPSASTDSWSMAERRYLECPPERANGGQPCHSVTPGQNSPPALCSIPSILPRAIPSSCTRSRTEPTRKQPRGSSRGRGCSRAACPSCRASRRRRDGPARPRG